MARNRSKEINPNTLPPILSYVFEVSPPPERMYFQFINPPKHLRRLFIPVSSKFATLDTYLIHLKITTYLCKNNRERDFVCIMFKGQFHLFTMLCKYFLCENYTSVRTLFEESPLPLARFRTLSWVPPRPLQSVRTF